MGPVPNSPHLVVSLTVSDLSLPYPFPLSLVSQPLLPSLSVGFHSIPFGSRHKHLGLLGSVTQCPELNTQSYNSIRKE